MTLNPSKCTVAPLGGAALLKYVAVKVRLCPGNKVMWLSLHHAGRTLFPALSSTRTRIRKAKLLLELVSVVLTDVAPIVSVWATVIPGNVANEVRFADLETAQKYHLQLFLTASGVGFQ